MTGFGRQMWVAALTGRIAPRGVPEACNEPSLVTLMEQPEGGAIGVIGAFATNLGPSRQSKRNVSRALRPLSVARPTGSDHNILFAVDHVGCGGSISREWQIAL